MELGQTILRRHADLIARRQIIENTWKDLFDYTFPIRGAGFDGFDGLEAQDRANSKKSNLYDSTAPDACKVLAAAMMSGLTPANSRWFDLDVANASEDERKWLEKASDAIWQNIHSSNYDAVAYECMLDMTAPGMFALFVDEAEVGGYQFEQWPLYGCYFAASKPGGMVDTIFREVRMSLEQMAATYGEDMMPEGLRKKLEKTPDEKVSVVQAIYPSGKTGKLAKNLPYASVHVDKQTKKVLRESGFHEMPVIVPRWALIPGSVYAVGPTYDALPDIKTLNEVVKFVLQNADLAIAGMWVGVDDGVLNPKTIKIGARRVVIASSTDSIKALSPAGKFDVAALQIDMLQKNIRRNLMADQLMPQDGPAMTATEVQVRVELIRQQLGPVYGRQQAEFLQPLIHRCFGLAYRAGALGMPPKSLQGRELNIVYSSPMARAQKLVDVGAMDRYEIALTTEAQIKPEVLDVYDWDKAAKMRSELLGVPAELIVKDEDIQALRENRAQQQQQAAAMQAMGEMAKQGA